MRVRTFFNHGKHGDTHATYLHAHEQGIVDPSGQARENEAADIIQGPPALLVRNGQAAERDDEGDVVEDVTCVQREADDVVQVDGGDGGVRHHREGAPVERVEGVGEHFVKVREGEQAHDCQVDAASNRKSENTAQMSNVSIVVTGQHGE